MLLSLLTGLVLAGLTQAQAGSAPSAPSAAQDTASAAMVGISADDRPGIAVLQFENGGSIGPSREDLRDLTVGLQQMLSTELAQNPSVRIVPRSALKEILEELDLGASGRIEPRTAARAGKLVGARYMVGGNVVDAFGELRLDGQIIDVETGVIINAKSVKDKREKLLELVVDLAVTVMKEVKLPPLPAQAVAARKERKIPPAAWTLYSKALGYQDRGEKDKAIELYRKIAQEFPTMTEAREELRQLTEG